MSARQRNSFVPVASGGGTAVQRANNNNYLSGDRVVPSRDDIFIVISVPAQTQEMVDTQDPLPSVEPLLERADACGPFRI